MKIQDNNIAGTSVPAKTDPIQSQQTARNHSNTRAVHGGDRVEISGFTGQISQSLSAADSSRTAYVDSIAAAVRSGTYKVDSHAISRSLVDEALARSGRS